MLQSEQTTFFCSLHIFKIFTQCHGSETQLYNFKVVVFLKCCKVLYDYVRCRHSKVIVRLRPASITIEDITADDYEIHAL